MKRDFFNDPPTFRGIALGMALMALLTLVSPAKADIDDQHPRHERAEQFVCDHPRHAERGHGLSILPEACH